MSSMAEVIAAHRPSRWRSFTTENTILRCCGQDFGNATKKAKRGDNERAYTDHAAHVAEELAKAGYGNVQEALLTAADAMEADPQFRDPLRLNSDRLRMYAHSLDPEGHAQAIHDRRAPMSEHEADGPYKVRGKWKAACFGCDYWTGYTSEARAQRMIDQHVAAKAEAT